MKHVELEQFLHASASRGFVSVSWAFLFYTTVYYSVYRFYIFVCTFLFVRFL